MIQFKYNELVVKLYNDSTYKFGSADNKHTYSKHYFGEDGQDYPTSKHAIKIYKDEIEINNCIIIASGGGTSIHENSALIDNNHLLICCCNTIFCLTLPDLNLNWQTQADPATCFEILQFKKDYLVHGELEITRLSEDGHIKWQFGGVDIFVTLKGDSAFKIENDHLFLTDWNYAEYKIDFDGNLISSTFK